MKSDTFAPLLARLIAVALFGAASLAHAQSSSLQIVVPWAPGGSADTIGRLVADQLSKQINRPVVVTNQPGAGGEIGATLVSKAKPDGNTLLFTTPAVTIVQTLRKNPKFDVRTDLATVTMAVESSMGLYVNPELPVRNIREFVAYAKANPGKLNYTSSGMGSSAHLYTELLKNYAGIDLVHIPYAGGSAYAMAVAANQAQLVIADSLGSPRGLAASGRLRMIAVGSAARSPAFPDVPTVSESGVPGYEIAYWIGFFAPPATPSPVIDRLNSELTAALRAAPVRSKLESQGYVVVGNTPAAFKAFIGKEVGKWEKLVRDANIARE